MGQQQTTVATAEEKGGGTLLRRMILVLAVAALMAVMAVSTLAGPAFARAFPPSNTGPCIQQVKPSLGSGVDTVQACGHAVKANH